MPYIYIENNKITGERSLDNENNEGWIYVDEFPAPAPSDYHEFSLEKGWYLSQEAQAQKESDELNVLIAANTQKRDELSVEAESQILILERKVKLKRATDEEKALLDRLYNYTVDLSELDLSQKNIVWPTLPN